MDRITLKPELWSKIIMPEKAYDKAWSLKEVQQLFNKTLAQGSKPLTEAGLFWNQADSSIFWRITFTDRVCDCAGEEIDAFNYARVVLNPMNLKVLELDLWEGIPEKTFEEITTK